MFWHQHKLSGAGSDSHTNMETPSEQGRDERTIQQINSCPVTKTKGNPSYYTLPKLSLLFQRRKTTVYIIPKTKGTLLEKSLSQKEMSFSRNKIWDGTKKETTEAC